MLFLILVFANLSLSYSGVCKGKWVQSIVPSEFIWGLNKSFALYDGSRDIIRSISPAESFYQNCYYNGITERSELLSYRKWQLDKDSPCTELTLDSLMKTIQNRNVYFRGDSIMRQVWQYLAGWITHEYDIPAADRHFEFQYHQVPNLYINATCPLGEDHCALRDEQTVRVARYNTSITFRFEGMYDPDNLRQFIKQFKITAKDIIVFNFGIHYNAERQMANDMNQFINDFKTLRDDLSEGRDVAQLLRTNFFFMESAPQHFANVDTPNGYYNRRYAAEWCDPLLEPLNVTKKADFRNFLTNSMLTPDDIPVIQIAEALYSQHDAHIGGDSKLNHFLEADCTHYCSHAPVFPYILMEVAHAVQNRIK